MRLFSRYNLISLAASLSVAVLLSATAGAENAIRFTSANAQPGDQVTIEMIMENDLTLGGASIPFRWSSADLALLEITIVRDRFVGGLRDTSTIEVLGAQTGSVLLIPKFSIFDRGMVPPGVGVMARLRFEVSPSAFDQTVRIDSFYTQISETAWLRPEYSDYDGLHTIYPKVYAGEIVVGTGFPPPFVEVLPSRLDFEAAAGGTDRPTGSLEVWSISGASFSWTAYTNASWLLVSPFSGQTPSYPFVTVDAGGLSPGTYRDTITITAPEAENSPLRVPVSLIVSQPRLLVPTAEVYLIGTTDDALVDVHTLTVEGEANSAIPWTARSRSAWLRQDATSGVTPSTVEITADLASLPRGTYFDTIVIDAPAAANSPRVIPVRLDVRLARSDEFDRLGIAVGPMHSNPFSLSTDASLRIAYELRDAMRIDLAVFDLLGRRVRTLVSQEQASGVHEVDWDGRDEHGYLVSSGHYFYRIVSPSGSVTRGVVLIK